MMTNHALENGPPRPACIHDRCTVGDGHSGPCAPVDPKSKGRLDRGLWWIITVLIVGSLAIGVAILAIGYAILSRLPGLLRGGG